MRRRVPALCARLAFLSLRTLPFAFHHSTFPLDFSPRTFELSVARSSALPSVPHSRAALATQARRVPDPSGHPFEVWRGAEACATVPNRLQPTDLDPSPDVAALARGIKPSTITRLRSPRTRIRHLAPRGGLRNCLRRFTPLDPARQDRFLAIRDGLGYQNKLLLLPVARPNLCLPQLPTLCWRENGMLEAELLASDEADGDMYEPVVGLR